MLVGGLWGLDSGRIRVGLRFHFLVQVQMKTQPTHSGPLPSSKPSSKPSSGSIRVPSPSPRSNPSLLGVGEDEGSALPKSLEYAGERSPPVLLRNRISVRVAVRVVVAVTVTILVRVKNQS